MKPGRRSAKGKAGRRFFFVRAADHPRIREKLKYTEFPKKFLGKLSYYKKSLQNRREKGLYEEIPKKGVGKIFYLNFSRKKGPFRNMRS